MPAAGSPGAVTDTGYDAASRTTSIFSRASNMDALSWVHYQYNDAWHCPIPGLPLDVTESLVG
ncbi:MAG: hypothetical protein GF320_18370 [Armatimonadia bacterium]|nr:hypothetical protein [Armatimonadia bacterium]